jgi:hypothetical protein
VRRLPHFLLLAALSAIAVTGCGDTSEDPNTIVGRWSQAINASDDESAADLFADDATVIQAGQSVTLANHEDALSFNASLPCGGKIVEQSLDGDEVTATFTLTRRPGHTCDGLGQTAVAVFKITDGRIVVWHQLPALNTDSQSA